MSSSPLLSLEKMKSCNCPKQILVAAVGYTGLYSDYVDVLMHSAIG